MKKLLITALLATATINAQYDHWSGQAKIGVTKIRDVTSVQPMNYDLGVRYMANTKFGGQISVNYTDIEDYSYQSASLMGVANAGRIMGFDDFTNWYTILVGIGGNYEYNHNETNDAIFHRLSNFHLSGSITNEFKLTRSVFLTAGLDVVTGVNSRPEPYTNFTETTSIIGFNAGITVSLGREREHADWYIEPVKKDTILLKPEIQNYFHETIREVEKPYKGYVQFAYDSETFINGSQALAKIKKAAESLKTGRTILLTGYASPENGTGDPDYNKDLASRRAETVKSYLISEGIAPERIEVVSKGALRTSDGNNIELSRTVRIEVK